MRSESKLALATVVLAFGFLGCAALDGAYEDRNDGPDVPVTATPPEDWRPPSPFIAGTSLIALQKPLRCHRYSTDVTQVAFTWTPSGQRRVYIAIFDEEPVRTDGVVNVSPVWTWMSGDSRSDVGRLHWDDGVLPGARDLPDWDSGMPPLSPGSYWFVIWAWDESRNVVASSEARLFQVGDLAAGQSELGYCCAQTQLDPLRIICAPELPPEAASCPGADAGPIENWPCYCDYRAAGEVCQ